MGSSKQEQVNNKQDRDNKIDSIKFAVSNFDTHGKLIEIIPNVKLGRGGQKNHQ